MAELTHIVLTSKTCPVCGMKLKRMPGWKPKKNGMDEAHSLVCTTCQPMLPLRRKA